MTSAELTDWLEEELAAFPERASGEELYARFVRITHALVADERAALVGACRDWLRRRTEPRTMLALELAAVHGLAELRPDVQDLLADVRAGRAFAPHYEEVVAAKLARL